MKFLFTVIKKWETEDILTVNEAKIMKHHVEESFIYLKTDFTVNLNYTSPVVSHCLQNSLSSANEPFFKSSCSDHQHTTTCARCKKFKNVLSEMLKIATNRVMENANSPTARKYEVEDDLVKTQQAINSFDDYRKHVIRAVNSEHQRLEIQKNLDENTVLLTLDWGHKVEPMFNKESQKQFFSKRGKLLRCLFL